jgi:hypothetical protein
MMKLLSFVLETNIIISCPMMNVCVHFWLVPHLFEEWIQSRVQPPIFSEPILT